MGVLIFGLVLFLIIAPIVAFVRSSRLVEKTKVLEKENDALRDQLRGITYHRLCVNSPVSSCGEIFDSLRRI